MKAIVMAGGKGTRLQPLTSNMPKPLTPVANRPMLEHIVLLLKKHGITDIIFTTRYLKEQIREHFGDGSQLGVNIDYFEENEPLGTAGGVKMMEDQLTETFLILSGDVLTDYDLSTLIRKHKESGSAATLGLKSVPNPTAFGVVITDDDGKIIKFLEKPGWSEVFSDTVNTGTYVLEPKVLELMPKGQEVDFSFDVFPAVLAANLPMYGFVDNCYWQDVGTPEKYIEAQWDTLRGDVKSELPGTKTEINGEEVWLGENVHIADNVIIRGPVVIGNNVTIEPDVQIMPFSSIGNNVTLKRGVVVDKAVIWPDAVVMKKSELSGCMVGSHTTVGSSVRINKFATIGDHCVIGRKSTILNNIRMWPRKVVEPGATVNNDVKTGVTWMKNLFGIVGINGMVNLEITPEFATKLGACIGTNLGKGSLVVVGRDTRKSSRMIKRAIVSGLTSVGANVLNVTVAPTPVIQYAVKDNLAQKGIAITGAKDPNQIKIKVFDKNGMDIEESEKRSIEKLFFHSELKRVPPEEIGEISYPEKYLERYKKSILNSIDKDTIKERRPKVIVDCASGAGSVVAPFVLQELGCEVISLNAQTGTTTGYATPTPEAVDHLGRTVKALNADFGIAYDLDADKMILISNTGEIVNADTVMSILTELLIKKDDKVVIPITSSFAVDETAKKMGGHVIRTKLGPAAIERAIKLEKATFGGDETGGVIFPEFQYARDGIYLAAKIAELFSKQPKTIAELAETVPKFNITRGIVEAPWELRGGIMRYAIEQSTGQDVETMDGIKIWFNDGWVLIRPDGSRPVFHIISESKDADSAKKYLDKYQQLIEDAKRTLTTDDVVA